MLPANGVKAADIYFAIPGIDPTKSGDFFRGRRQFPDRIIRVSTPLRLLESVVVVAEPTRRRQMPMDTQQRSRSGVGGVDTSRSAVLGHRVDGQPREPDHRLRLGQVRVGGV